MARDIYTADMGQPPANDDMGSIEDTRGQLRRPPMAPRRPMGAPMAPKRGMAGAANAMSRDLGALEDDMGSIENKVGQLRPQGARQEKAARAIKSAMGMKKGGKVCCSASKRADGIAKKGKTKGRFV